MTTIEENGPCMLSDFEMLREEAKRLEVSIPLQAPFTPSDINKLMPLLRLPLNESAIQSAKSQETGKGYDSIGYSYQAHIDRMNWIFGPTQWTWAILNEECEDSATAGGYLKYIFSCEIALKIGYRTFDENSNEWNWLTVYELPPIPSDHESLEKGSARKGCLTKGIKRATSFLGVGADAYLGVLDDDLSTGAVRNDQMKTPVGRTKLIDSKGYIQLKNLAAAKGLKDDTRLREFYRIQSEDRITNDPASLTTTEASEVKSYLLKLPDLPLNQSESLHGDDEELKEPDLEPDEKPKRPQLLAELIAAPEDVVRELAAEYSFNLPETLTAKNKSVICKTLAQLMGLK